jgi:hypothetical protein
VIAIGLRATAGKCRCFLLAAASQGAHTADNSGEGGVLRFDFAEKDVSLEEISWKEFFEIFKENGLALIEQEETRSGRISRFSKFVNR